MRRRVEEAERAPLAVWVLALGCLAGCAPAPDRPGGPEADGSPADAETVVATAAAADSGSAVDSAGAAAPAPAPDTAMPAVPTLPGEGEPREFQLLLVNRLAQAAFVHAQAGAAPVALDTVPPMDSVRVDIRVRADRVDLSAEGSAGRPLARTTLELVPGVINRWEIGGASAGAVEIAAAAPSSHPARTAHPARHRRPVLRPAPVRPVRALVASERRAYRRFRQ